MCQTNVLVSPTRPPLSQPFAELNLSVPSRLDAMSPLTERVTRFIAQVLALDRDNVDDIELAVQEAVVNAVVHGNAEDPEKHVYVTCQCNLDGEVSITIRDEGPGFEYDRIADPTAPENRLSTHGRGIYLMKAMMDEVRFERGGSVVVMRKKSTGTRV